MELCEKEIRKIIDIYQKTNALTSLMDKLQATEAIEFIQCGQRIGEKVNKIIESESDHFKEELSSISDYICLLHQYKQHLYRLASNRSIDQLLENISSDIASFGN